MRPVAVRILLPPAPPFPDGPEGWLAAARRATAERHAAIFRDEGAADVAIVTDPVKRSFGARLRDLARDAIAANRGRATGLVVVSGGAMPLARGEDLRAFLDATQVRSQRALANSWYSADAIAVPDASVFADLPDLPSDNALPRWLAERAATPVADLRDRSQLAVDLDSPVDVLLVARARGCPDAVVAIAQRVVEAHPAAAGAIDRVAAVFADRRAELLVAGRTSSRTLEWLERRSAGRVRALVEERGLRASSPLALGDADSDKEPTDDAPRTWPQADLRLRPPRSVLGFVLDDRGPTAFGRVLAELADAAIIDTRVLLAHRMGVHETGWPSPSDRFASDLLAPERIDDPWLRDLTASAAAAGIPVLLGGHTLVGPGLPLLGGNR